jgi:arylsulfatase A-like enzyme
MQGNLITRREWLRSAGAAACMPLVGQTQTRRPNLLMIYADDLGWGDVGFNGRKEWSTPNLDRLAREGTVFNRWYTGSPLCAPSRACLLTGRYTIHNTVRGNGIDLPAGEVTFAEALKPLGYDTTLIGKWHRGGKAGDNFTHPLDQGFQSTFGYLDARHAWEHFPKELYDGRQRVPVEGYSADILADRAIAYMKQKRDNPYLLYLAFIEPHFLIEAPEENVAKFRGKFKEKDPSKPFNAAYAGMIERMDAAIGRVLKALEETGQARDTLVVFTADNGATFESGSQGAPNYHDSNRPFRGQKRSLEEGGIREPAVVRWPGRVSAGRKSEDVIHMIDVLPTFMAAAGGKPDPAWNVDGMNMLDVWTGKAKAPDRTLFWEFQTEGISMHAAMRGDFKLLEIGGNRFLYNLAVDPGERRTLGPQHPDVFKSLQADLKSWLATEVRPQ